MKERESHRVEVQVLLNESHESGLSYRETSVLHGGKHQNGHVCCELVPKDASPC